MRLKTDGDVDFGGTDKKTFKKELVSAARWFDIDHAGLPVIIEEPRSNSRTYGRCYYKPQKIKIYDHGRSVKEKVKTFVHELKHLDDHRNYRIKNRQEIPTGREDRCEIWADDWAEKQGLQHVEEE